MGETKTALQMIEDGFDGAPYLDELPESATDEVERYVGEKREAVRRSVDFVKKRQAPPWCEGAAISVSGPMRAAKTPVSEAIVEALVREGIVSEKKHVSTLVDKRSEGLILSQSGCEPVDAETIESIDERGLIEFAGAVHFEEVQFWDPGTLEGLVRARTRSGKVTVFSGLDRTYTGEEWPSAQAIKRLGEQLTDQLGIVHLRAICQTCHGGAEFTQLEIPDESGQLVPAPSNLFKGAIAPETGELVFSARCAEHHEVGGPIEVESEM